MVSSLGIGGAERSSAILSRMLVDSGYDVTIISILDEVMYEYKGNLINLERRIGNHKGLIKKFLKLYVAKKVFARNNFDYIIDGRPRQSWGQQWLTNMLLFNKVPTVFVVHSYRLSLSFPRQKILAKKLYKNAYKLVAVSKAALQNFESTYNFSNGICIYNAFDERHWNSLSKVKEEIPKYDYILSYGRIDEKTKNYSFLIESFYKSRLPQKGIKLIIMGDGADKVKIKNLVTSLNLEDSIVFQGFKENPFPLVKHALFAVLTSNYEGFPMVLIESLAMGTPVVSVDCKSGPSEVVVTGKNGILVPFKDEKAYVEALNTMIENRKFYIQCKAGAIQSVSKFKVENIIPQWQAILPSKR